MKNLALTQDQLLKERGELVLKQKTANSLESKAINVKALEISRMLNKLRS